MVSKPVKQDEVEQNFMQVKLNLQRHFKKSLISLFKICVGLPDIPHILAWLGSHALPTQV